MKKLSFVIAVLAALSTVVVPVAPAQAAVEKKADAKLLLQQAQRGNALILTQPQMDNLSRTNPGLYSKLTNAYHSNTIPALSAQEKRQLQTMTRKNIAEVKAGNPAAYATSGALLAGAGIFVGVFVLILIPLLILLFGQNHAAMLLFQNFLAEIAKAFSHR